MYVCIYTNLCSYVVIGFPIYTIVRSNQIVIQIFSFISTLAWIVCLPLCVCACGVPGRVKCIAMTTPNKLSWDPGWWCPCYLPLPREDYKHFIHGFQCVCVSVFVWFIAQMMALTSVPHWITTSTTITRVIAETLLHFPFGIRFVHSFIFVLGFL